MSSLLRITYKKEGHPYDMTLSERIYQTYRYVNVPDRDCS
ncbi:hypothetical protein HMPREF1987_02316 [Peptostreptococcaceae bacterium oral taxon 113 str. W5053]|nr:hypothetical protein HMPREF1987_02316 [Peptostreptococcaceae bacterium oral taxon 113 str. W5053]